jgi:protein SCO1/2
MSVKHIEDVILRGAVLQAKRRACPEPDGEGISRGLKRIGQYRVFLPLVLLAMTAASAFGQAMTKGIMSPPSNVRPPRLQNVGIEQHLDAQVPQDLPFTDDAGRPVKLGDYFGKKPLILNLDYYNCTMLCGEVLSGLTGAMKMVKFNVGDEFDVVTISFNPQETPQIAAAKKQDYLKRYGRPGAASGWHFLTGPAESINALTKAVGFQYQYDPKSSQYAHATAIMVLTPQGRISRYFYGVDYPPKDLRMGLVEASQNKIGNAVDQVLLYCYHYDPATGKYGAIVNNILKLGAALTILLLGGLLFVLFRLEKAAPPRRDWRAVKAGQPQ